MMHPLLEVIEVLKPRRPIGCRAAFCVYCLCLSRHLVYHNPIESWRRAVGSAQQVWARYQVCQVCQVRSPHRGKDRLVDPLTGLRTPIQALWESTCTDRSEAKTLSAMQLELSPRRTVENRHTAALTGATYALEDRIREWQRGVDKLVVTTLLFCSIALVAMFLGSPHAVALLVGLFPAAALVRLVAMRRFERREVRPIIGSFLQATGITEREYSAFVQKHKGQLPSLTRRLKRIEIPTANHSANEPNHPGLLKPEWDYLPPRT